MENSNNINFDNYYDQTRFRLVRNACLATSLILALITLQNLTNPHYSYIPNLIGVLMGVTGLIFLHFTKRFKPVAIFLSLASFTIISLTFLKLTGTLHYTTPLYMIMNILFTFFTLKLVWGILLFAAHFSVMIVYFYTRLIDNVTNLPTYTNQDLLTFSTEYIICGIGIVYLIYLFLQTSTRAESKLKEHNVSLQEKNSLIVKQNEEMDVMLREIHHRVKNNLQIITSMLRLQFQNHPDSHSKEFSDAINRINAMSLIHEKLYQSNMLTNFNLQNYLESLTSNVMSSFSNRPIDVTVDVQMESISTKSIVPLALLYNELLTNSIKHAFDATESPTISAKLVHQKDKQFTLTYRDNGCWKESTRDSFGLDLVQAMTEQLDGIYTIERNESGTEYCFELIDQE